MAVGAMARRPLAALETVTLSENATTERPIHVLEAAAGIPGQDLAGALDGLIALEPAWQSGCARLRTGSVVGTRQVGALRVDVKPKLAADEFATLVRYALGGSVGAIGRSAVAPAGGGLDDLIGGVLADELARLRQAGLSRNYVTRQERLRVVRGRPDFTASFPWNPAGNSELSCKYAELTCDNLDNRLVRAALDRSVHLDVSALTRQRLMEHRYVWAELASSMQPLREAFRVARSRYTRLSEHYLYAHNLCELIMSRLSARHMFKSGVVSTGGLSLSMAALFEAFVARLLRDELCPRGFAVRAQSTDKGALLDGKSHTYRRVRPDLLVSYGGKPLAVVDAKYKQYWPARGGGAPERRLGNDDIYQLFFYAQRLQVKYQLPRSPTAVIVAPLPAPDEREAPMIAERYRTIEWRAGIDSHELRLVLLPVTEILRSLGDYGDTRSVSEAVEELVRIVSVDRPKVHER